MPPPTAYQCLFGLNLAINKFEPIVLPTADVDLPGAEMGGIGQRWMTLVNLDICYKLDFGQRGVAHGEHICNYLGTFVRIFQIVTPPCSFDFHSTFVFSIFLSSTYLFVLDPESRASYLLVSIQYKM